MSVLAVHVNRIAFCEKEDIVLVRIRDIRVLISVLIKIANVVSIN